MILLPNINPQLSFVGSDRQWFIISLIILGSILILKNSPVQAKEMRKNLSEDDFTLIENLAKDEKSPVNSLMLLDLLKAYDMTGKSYIESLSLEMMVIAICV
mgnify:CR=1 FL=1